MKPIVPEPLLGAKWKVLLKSGDLPFEFSLCLMENVLLVPGGKDAVLESALPLWRTSH
jgi:hypothetical protein